MRQTERGSRYVVYDDFLAHEEFEQAIGLMARSGLADTQSVISPSLDGPATRSRGMTFTASIGDGQTNGRPAFFSRIAQAVHGETQLFGNAGAAWNKITFTFWQYPAGSRLGWHNDAGRGREGEFILYLHRQWDISWGGELMLIDRDPQSLLHRAGADGAALETASPDVRLREILRVCEVSPLAVLPRPNRLVLVKANTIHTVRRVDHTAEDNKRCTLTGFVYRDEASRPDRSWAADRATPDVLTDVVRLGAPPEQPI